MNLQEMQLILYKIKNFSILPVLAFNNLFFYAKNINGDVYDDRRISETANQGS